jgi:predicted nucleic acid-binding protein
MVHRVCLDANVLLDIILDRKRKSAVLKKIDGTQYATTSISASIAYYYAVSDTVSNNAFKNFLRDYDILTVDELTFESAFMLAGDQNDLEDAIQIAACKQAGVQTLVTADKQLAKLYAKELKIELVE